MVDGENGTILNHYTYDAFGNTIHCEEQVHNRFRYNGEQYDPVTSQYYLRARFYNPAIARFTQEDTYYGDGLNLYRYCANNPVEYKDPSGHNICPGQLDLYKKYRAEGMSPRDAYDRLRTELGLSSKNPFTKDSEGGTVSVLQKQLEGGTKSRFSAEEIANLKKAVIDEGQALKDMGLTNKELGPAIAGAYDKSTGKIYTAINDLHGDIPTELSPFIKERIENMPSDALDSYEKTKGAGSHAEVYAVNKLLLDNPSARIEDICVYVNKTLGTSKPVIEIPFETCPHCRYILEGLEIISNK